MEKKEINPSMKRQRKFMLAMPVLVLPFVILMFWSLGGGKVQDDKIQNEKQVGFNIKLPDANIKEKKPMDKMAYYDQANRDSSKFEEMVKNDPNYMRLTDHDGDASQVKGSVNGGMNTLLHGSGNDPNADKIYSRLDQINREMNRPSGGGSGYRSNQYVDPGKTKMHSADVDRLEKMMQMMNQSEEDPEMAQLNGMLEKIIDIQNPGLAQQKMKEASAAKRGQVFPVTSLSGVEVVSLLGEQFIGNDQTGFFSLGDKNAELQQNAIQAVIHETQEVVNGSTIKLRLVNDIFINGTRIPKDNFVFGTVSLNGERLGVEIKSIRFVNSLFPVDLVVYDMDGLDGLYIPGAITRDVAKESADRSMKSISIPSIDGSWGAQAAGAGVEAAKTLFGKKVKLVRVTVKAGYQVLLYDEKQKQNQSH